jgi:hypothetical protein
MYYNFVRIHQTLKVTPAMAAGVTKRLWEMSDVVDMLEAPSKPASRMDRGCLNQTGPLPHLDAEHKMNYVLVSCLLRICEPWSGPLSKKLPH